ncbi:hypothetical protein N0O92_04090 [Alkalihalobacillus sp. MEB130]|uniref:hypothetical protein n=1 Tax=Alkalihalobacillus sp. MEB130 TaxID=2976704 RepID=UPI0028DDFEEC|nr:hypothetical protein [Alkalihalobacillus sp. MEB130]MDT8859403.1 hypothetical protein [Alkalihalobacillus sp. MEB130]
MKQRLFLSFLLSIAMIVYGIEYLPFDGTGVDRVFAWSWMVFALFVVSGNGLHLLYQKKRRKRVAVPIHKMSPAREKMRG